MTKLRAYFRSTRAKWTKKAKMCSYYDLHGILPGHPDMHVSWRGVDPRFFEKNKRVKCPVCGRKMWAARRVCSDGDDFAWCVPPHKVKGWWRRPKKQSRRTAGRSRVGLFGR